jgi:hypothetical protein
MLNRDDSGWWGVLHCGFMRALEHVAMLGNILGCGGVAKRDSTGTQTEGSASGWNQRGLAIAIEESGWGQAGHSAN